MKMQKIATDPVSIKKETFGAKLEYLAGEIS
jgi:hypothetical protein